MGRIFTGETEALLQEKYEPVYEKGKLLHYKDRSGHIISFYVDRTGKNLSWRIFRERHDGERLNDEKFVRGEWKAAPLLYRYLHDAQVDDATLEEVIETANEIDKAFAEYARENPQDD